MDGVNWPALILSFRLGCGAAWNETLAIVGSAVLFATVTLSYGELWRNLPQADIARLHLTHAQLIWYLVLAQLFSRGIGFGIQDVQIAVRSGAVEVAMLRPVPFWSLTLADWMGRQCVQLACLLPLAILFGYALTRLFPFDASAVLLPLSSALCLIGGLGVSFLIGGATLWLGEGGPASWLFQKVTLILGGLLCPLAFYPHWLQTLAWFTPFPAFAAFTGNFALNRGFAGNAMGLALQLFWTACILAACAGLARLMRIRIAMPA